MKLIETRPKRAKEHYEQRLKEGKNEYFLVF